MKRDTNGVFSGALVVIFGAILGALLLAVVQQLMTYERAKGGAQMTGRPLPEHPFLRKHRAKVSYFDGSTP